MRLAPGSLRARVTLVSAVGAGAALAIALLLLYTALDRQLWAALDSGLRTRADDLAAAVRAGDLTELGGDPMAQLYSADGRLIAGSAALRGRLLDPGEVRGVREPVPTTRTVPLGSRSGSGSARLLARRLVPEGRVLVVGVPAGPVHAARDRLQLVLFVAAPLLVLLLALAARAVVRTALRPVDALTREASDISSLEAERRLPVPDGDDEIARLARTLNDMLARLQAAAARERAFVDDASHELRTPIAVIRGELELAGAAGPGEEVRQSLRAALGETDRLARLAEDLLLLARARAGSPIVRTEPVDLLDLAAEEARRLGGLHGLAIEASGDPVVVEADPERLRQVLANLAGNSAAAGARNVRVEVRTGGDGTTVEVADDGPGFPDGMATAAFTRFTRGDDARGSRGAGLGLSIVHAVIAAHRGTVTAANGGPLGGAVVTVRLPAT
ncbi:HAMP domain-containing sensor histidine kinase [Actinomadura madurae]|uniref:HAMP domain-containing sensor histidine kinase n=1 Tax=Actinomadura madurae TaxID=1993 RepID=UPI000D89EF90|nr:HAMP domain-containing sensor histidine kinase [Actinomadura madurae]SPT63709.1 Probable sensor histidine kinase TcrY [Actinomadura madurae]